MMMHIHSPEDIENMVTMPAESTGFLKDRLNHVTGPHEMKNGARYLCDPNLKPSEVIHITSLLARLAKIGHAWERKCCQGHTGFVL
jgi:hypothetical protein